MKKQTDTIARIQNILILLVSMMTIVSCTSSDDNNDTDRQKYTGIPLVIFDTDIGSSTDDLFAMQMLYRYADEGRCKLLGIVVDREGDDYAALADVMNTYFGYADLPIGVERSGVKHPSVFIDYKGLYKLTVGAGEPMFRRTLSDYSTLPDGWKLYRQLLASQPDHSVSICSTGFVCNLDQLLASQPDQFSPLTGIELIRQKVKCLYLMAGVFTSSEEPDYNFLQAPEFAQRFMDQWPQDVDIVFSPMEVGNEIEYRPETVISDIHWTDIHPIKQVYKNYPCDTGQKMWDPLTVIHAVEGDALFTLSERGIVTLTPQYGTAFTPSATGHCRYQKQSTPAWYQSMLEKIRKAVNP
jgi:inosine-uridine nucleoside N-ribohydrolase